MHLVGHSYFAWLSFIIETSHSIDLFPKMEIINKSIEVGRGVNETLIRKFEICRLYLVVVVMEGRNDNPQIVDR